MIGKENGVVTLLERDFPRVKSKHCVAHKLELSVKNALKAVTSTNHFEIFLTKLYTLYHQSNKNQRELKMAASGARNLAEDHTHLHHQMGCKQLQGCKGSLA